MNPFLNPSFLSRVIWSYLVDMHRLRRIDVKSLEKLRDKNLRKIVRYAYSVPLYHEKYKKAGVHPSDIKGINDISKLPFITKSDIRKNFPDDIVPPSFNKRETIMSYTSGTTGRPVSIYVDMYTITRELLGYVRGLREHNAWWWKTRMTVIVDLSENSVESEYLTDGVVPLIRPFFSLNNIQIFNISNDEKKVIKKMNSFQPEFIVGYPGMLRQLALLKRKGYGKDIWPRCIVSCGSVLDKYFKKYVEETFETQVFDAYGAMESGPMAFQCKQGNYHIHSDLVHLEITNDNGESVSPGDPGKVVVTRLYGRGTPIIRYTGLDDIITATDEICDCGLASGMIKEIHGRENQSIVLSDGRILLPSSLARFFGEISDTLDIDKIERFQMVQYKIDEIEILTAVDKDLRGTDPSVEKIFSTIQKRFKEKFGPNIKIKVKEVDRFKPHTLDVISKVDMSKVKKKIYI